MRPPILIAIIAVLGAMAPLAGAEDWKAPPEEAAVANPVPATAESIAHGKELYIEHCLDCHGATGAGDGEGAELLGIELESLSDPAVTAQSDGALFWKTAVGRNDMPGYKKDGTIPNDEDLWHLVNYMRALAPATEE